MNDEDGPLIAKIVYTEMMKKGTFDPDVVAFALDTAVQTLRKSGALPHRWAPYIHLGA